LHGLLTVSGCIGQILSCEGASASGIRLMWQAQLIHPINQGQDYRDQNG